MKNAGKIAKHIITFIVFLLCGLFIFRCCIAGDQSVLKSLTVTDTLREAYAWNPDLEMLTHEMPFELSEDGYLSGYALVMIPSIAETQITLRYNDSIFSYNDLPEDATFTYRLTDSVTGAEVVGEVLASQDKWMYNYRRVIFDGLSWTEENNLTVSLWCGETKITELLLHHVDMNVVNEPYKLSRADKNALTGN
ncbi:MAG: hypothetical protein IJZ08_03190 [Clostridia bacterium]|nr:hypothetical protein [Clostridia bacterium]